MSLDMNAASEAMLGRPKAPVRRAIAGRDGQAAAARSSGGNGTVNGSGNGRGNGPRVPFRMPRLQPLRFPDRTFDIRDYGAIADGATDCTTAIAAAIAACAEAGGGRVLIPAGHWFTGPIHLCSNINLHLEQGAILRFCSDPRRYLPAVFVRWGGQECYNYSPLIYARDSRNVAITGTGTLMGQGAEWRAWGKHQSAALARLYDMVLDGTPVEQRRLDGEEHALRPQFILAINCTNVLLEDFTIGDGGPLWSVHAAYCRNVVVRRLRIDALGPNNDGIVIDSTRDVLIEDCDLNTSDDSIALKSGLNEDGWRVGRPTENILIRNVRATAGEGGITIGSEMSGGVRNVLAHDCHCDGPTAGIQMKASRGRGGVVENIFMENITMGEIPGDAIRITAEFPSFARQNGRPPVFRNVHLRGITCRQAKTAVRMIGLADSALQNITLEDVTIAADEGLHCTAGSDVRLVNVKITPRSGPVLSLRDSQEILIQGLNSVIGSSVFLDVRGRRTRNIRLRGEANEQVRPAVVLGVDVPRGVLVHE